MRSNERRNNPVVVVIYHHNQVTRRTRLADVETFRILHSKICHRHIGCDFPREIIPGVRIFSRVTTALVKDPFQRIWLQLCRTIESCFRAQILLTRPSRPRPLCHPPSWLVTSSFILWHAKDFVDDSDSTTTIPCSAKCKFSILHVHRWLVGNRNFQNSWKMALLMGFAIGNNSRVCNWCCALPKLLVLFFLSKRAITFYRWLVIVVGQFNTTIKEANKICVIAVCLRRDRIRP